MIQFEYESQFKMFNWERKYVEDMSMIGWELVQIIQGDKYSTGYGGYPQTQYQWIWRRPV